MPPVNVHIEEFFQQLSKTLNAAFTTKDRLGDLTQLACGKTVDQLAIAGDLGTIIAKIIQRARQERWIGNLLKAAWELRSGDKKLTQLYQDFQANAAEFERIEEESRVHAVCQFLKAIEDEFNTVRLFHIPQEIVLQDQYIPIEVTLERRYRHEVETTWGYLEGEVEFSRAYAMKGSEEMQEETRRVQVPWQEAKQKHKRIIVLADPGMGKTALLKIEAVTTAQQERQLLENKEKNVDEVILPLFLKLFDLAKKPDEEIIEAILHYLQHRHQKIFTPIKDLVRRKLEQGTCLLLLDALDEVPREQRLDLAENLNIFARNYPCPIIVTSRIVGYGGGILHDAKEVEIVPFSRKQTEEYIETWFKNATSPQTPLLRGEGLSEDAVLPRGEGFSKDAPLPQGEGLSETPPLLVGEGSGERSEGRGRGQLKDSSANCAKNPKFTV